MPAILLNHITKSYDGGRVIALDDVSLQIENGALFGLIGPDGAGKTSLFRILTTLLLADKGSASVSGFDVVKDYQAIRNSIGYMPGKFSLYQDLTVHENLEFFAALFGTTINENYALIKDIYEQIKPFSQRRAGKLSGGMKQKLALCCALIHKPDVLFLDEPTTGVDVVSRREFWLMLRKLKSQGITILVSTPYMDEAMQCERIALIQGGKILAVDSPAQIIQAYPGRLYGARAKNSYQLLQSLRMHEQVTSAYAFGESLHITLATDSDEQLKQVREYARQKGYADAEIVEIDPTIEDSFIRLMKDSVHQNQAVKE
jgi:ABC-2 type transport system ATP-binding protein